MKLLTLKKPQSAQRGDSTASALLRNVFHVFFLIQVFIFFPYAHTFNLDTKIPIVKFGPKGSYFGYSVAEHVTLNSGHSSQRESV